ncbi:VWA domain-containing protein [Rhodococcus sp. BP-241]|uniref:MadC family VWA domain-containing protein n=1 Tax=Rhodococcus sp. BP-241 TaxID=2739441 RepID=UPI001C9BB6EA|nr:VWA domain-containing protein [Rhodococcus sp. BP-241]MBY6709341.1 VWA domain-containing protein [Rhodococcus sp. BP-241]
MTTTSATPARVLDVLSAVFGRLLRRFGVAASPAEVIEVRRVLGLIGASDTPLLRSALRATCAKYPHEQEGFDLAFSALFDPVLPIDEPGRTASAAAVAGGLPTDLEVSGEEHTTARYADFNERAADVGEHFDTPDAEQGFNPHKDDDDLSLTSSDSQVSVDADSASGRRGVTFTVDVDRADSATVGELSSDDAVVSQGTLRWDDPNGILGWLDAYDPAAVYGDALDAGEMTRTQLDRLAEAIEAFVDALARSAGGTTPATEADPNALSRVDVDGACREILRRMRGAPRPRPREHGRGRLDMRRTVRAGMRTDGVPFHLIVRTPVPEQVRLLVLADVSLSVRPITAFTLRLAQSMRHRVNRCTVLAFVDRPVDVTDELARSTGDDALATVLSSPELDLEASSDYGRVLDEVLTHHGSFITSRTSVIVVGDGRCNGLPAGVDRLQEISRRVHRLAWITPESERYWDQASCSMREYADVCDGVVVARDARQLIDRAPELGNALR